MTRNFPPGDIRASDADRDAAIAELSQHFQAGRLTQEEFDERSGLALRARTGNDLSELFTDLPQLSSGPQSPPQPPGPSPVPPWAPEPRPARPVGQRHPFPPVLAGIIAVIVVSNVAGDLAGQVHHPVFSWVIIVVIFLVLIRIARRTRRLPPALLVRTVLVPASLLTIGERAWWLACGKAKAALLTTCRVSLRCHFW